MDEGAEEGREEIPAVETTLSRRGEQRYVLGERRTTAQPLAASWNPERDSAARPVPKRRGRWLVYALPVLIVLTLLAVLNAHGRGTQPAAAGTTTTAPPVATEQPARPVNAGSGTAVLPPGDAYPQAGTGTWHVVPGTGPVVGKGPHLYHYRVAVEDGIDPSIYGGDDAFAKTVDAVLDDPRSWIAAGTVSLQRVDNGYPTPDFTISLTTPNTDHRPDLCGYDITYEASCWRASAQRVVINLARWVRGALAFDGDLGLYRQYAINHEVGHAFGNLHVGCAANGGLAPVMMQQTFGVSDDYVWQLNQVDPANRDRVPEDGKVCRPNAWPYPQGPGDPASPPG